MSQTGPGVTSLNHASDSDETRQLEDYLNDTLAPLQVADSIVAFLGREPERANRVISRWADQQLNVNLHAIPISDLLYHALKKIQVFEDLGLAESDSLQRIIETAACHARSFCPQDELAEFDAKLTRLYEDSRMLKTVEFLHRAGLELDAEPLDPDTESEDLDELRKRAVEARSRPPESALPAPAAPETPTAGGDGDNKDAEPSEQRSAALLAERRKHHPDVESIRQDQVTLGLKRFSMLVQTLESATRKPQDSERKPWVAHLLSSAALGARNYKEFQEYLNRLKELGLQDLHMEQLVKSVAETLPDWYLEGGPAAQPPTAATVAMERIVDLSEHESEKSERLKEVVDAAVGHFNRRRLGSALTLFELAEKLIGSSELNSVVEKQIRASARPRLHMGPFRKLSGNPEHHPQLRRVLNFFPDLRVEGLVRRLLKEENRRARHLIMDLLRIHGQEAREAVAELLISSTTLSGREWPWYFVRNLIRILRDVPVTADAVAEFELEAVIVYADTIHAIQVVREAVAYLGTVLHPKATEALVQLYYSYRDGSGKLRKGAGTDMAKIQSLALTYMLRSDSPHARTVALDAILADARSSGDFQLLKVLNGVNLTTDRNTLDRLLRTIRLRLPGHGLTGSLSALRMQLPRDGWMGKLRGFGATKEAALQSLIQALAGTPAPEVSEILGEVEELALTEGLVRLARKTRTALEEKSFDVAPGSHAILAGDLEVFGLPNVIQSLSHSEASGTLIIEAKQSNRRAAVRLQHGRFVDAKAGKLRGVEAFYLLMELPLLSSFRFVADNGQKTAKSPQELKTLLFEGMRRRDEFERLRLLVHDEALFKAPDVAPTLPPGEPESALSRRLWGLLKESPRKPAQLEALGLADPYRLRKLLAFWLDSGQLRAVESTSNP